MSSKTLTIWELSNEQKIEQFYLEILEYMIINLPYVNIYKGYIYGGCGYDHFSHEYETEVNNHLWRFSKFCECKGYNPEEAIDVLRVYTDEYYTCDCDILYAVTPTPRLEALVKVHHPE